ncbi:MAG: TonB-dependent receptor plug domain-containing protein [Bacteroides sp.]|nr:TonB-dependent receptor plug domain-containing protein [Bacteroides sp.]
MEQRNLSILFLLLCLQSSSVGQVTVTDTVRIQFWTDSVELAEVKVAGKRTPAANSRFSDLLPVELVTAGGANGDLYQALQTLPGTQVQGECGRLLVRGGSANETQTFIDGMHVLNPYTSSGINSSVRSRYSTFMFSGVNLASGGAPQEYGEALSAVLPLETKDYSRVNKLGLNASVVGVGGGGTRSFDRGSLSVDINYQDLTLYDKLYKGRREFQDPYCMYSVASQWRYTPDADNILKCYVQYDRTDFSSWEGVERRLFNLSGDNVYFNTTYRHTSAGGWETFFGTAYSFCEQTVGGAASAGDEWKESRQELHLKAKLARRFSPSYRMEAGVENYIRHYESSYRLLDRVHTAVSPIVTAAFLSATYYPWEHLKGEISCRAEYNRLNHRTQISPRLALNYYLGNVMLSAIAGRYTQLPENDYLVHNRNLYSETCTQFTLGAQYHLGNRFWKAELYYKEYRNLALLAAEGATEDFSLLWQLPATAFTSNGYGRSKGIDLFFRDPSLLKHFEYQLSYTYNLSKRKYRSYAELTIPQYATRHNAALVLKYTIPRLNSIIGLTNRFSSGRPYHNPSRPGLFNDEVKPYNSLDVGITYLPSKKVIIHASATNILGRKNVFGQENGTPILASDDHFFYVGIFLTLGKKAAYDVSNF